MDFICAQAEDGICPCAAAVPVGNHLSLIDDRHVIVPVQIRHFHCRGLHITPLYPDLLLAGDQGTGHAGQIEIFKLLCRQETQRAQIDSAPGTVQPHDAFVRLSGIGRPQMQHKTPVHLPGQGIQIPVVLGHRVQERPAKRPLV